VAQALAAGLELRRRPLYKAARRNPQERLAREHFVHVLRIVRPVGRRVQRAAGR
jgi:hypothetical protein